MDSSSVQEHRHRQRFSDVEDHLYMSSLELSDIISLSGLPESTLPIAPPRPRESDHGKESSFSSKRRRTKSSPSDEANDFAFPFLEEDELLQMTKHPRKRKNRTAREHNFSEKKRRDRIEAKMKVLRELIPNSHKLDRASLLDKAISHMKALKLQLQVMQGTSLLPYQSIPVGTLQCPGAVPNCAPFLPQATPNVGSRTDMVHLGVPFGPSFPSVAGFFSTSMPFLPVNPYFDWRMLSSSTSVQSQLQPNSTQMSCTSKSPSSIFEGTDETVNEN